jgi:hypothetical protein
VGQTSNVDPDEIHVLLSRTELARLVDLTQQPHDAELHDRLAAILRQFSRYPPPAAAVKTTPGLARPAHYLDVDRPPYRSA